MKRSKVETKKLLEEVKKSMLKVKKQGIKLPKSSRRRKTLRSIKTNLSQPGLGSSISLEKKSSRTRSKGKISVKTRKKTPAGRKLLTR